MNTIPIVCYGKCRNLESCLWSFNVMKQLFLLILCVLSLSACENDPTSIFKVKDPADSRFDPMKFSYLDYRGTVHLQEIFPKIFPVGTDKAFVDKVLIDAGGAFARKRNVNPKYPDWIKYNYIYRGTTYYRKLLMLGPVTENMGFYFDKENKVVQITKGPKFLIKDEKEN